MPADRKAMGLVTNLLDQMQPGMITPEPHLCAGISIDQRLEPRLAGSAFRHTHHFDTGNIVGCEYLPCLTHLPFSAVDKQNIR